MGFGRWTWEWGAPQVSPTLLEAGWPQCSPHSGQPAGFSLAGSPTTPLLHWSSIDQQTDCHSPTTATTTSEQMSQRTCGAPPLWSGLLWLPSQNPDHTQAPLPWVTPNGVPAFPRGYERVGCGSPQLRFSGKFQNGIEQRFAFSKRCRLSVVRGSCLIRPLSGREGCLRGLQKAPWGHSHQGRTEKRRRRQRKRARRRRQRFPRRTRSRLDF